jgi:hypothetical protein
VLPPQASGLACRLACLGGALYEDNVCFELLLWFVVPLSKAT